MTCLAWMVGRGIPRSPSPSTGAAPTAAGSLGGLAPPPDGARPRLLAFAGLAPLALPVVAAGTADGAEDADGGADALGAFGVIGGWAAVTAGAGLAAGEG